MTLVSASLPNLINGVSQQPAILRLNSQAEVCDNTFPSVVNGLGKRPPTRHLIDVSTPPADSMTHIIDRDEDEKYIVQASPSGIRVWDLNGNEKTVSAPGGYGYLATSDPRKHLKMTTVADNTFVLNSSVEVLSDTGIYKAAGNIKGFVWVRQAAYDVNYTITVLGQVASYRTPVSSGADTENIAAQLAAILIAAAPFQMLITRIGSLIVFEREGGSDFSLTADDSAGDSHMVLVKDQVGSFSELPERGHPNLHIEITGSPDEDDQSGYWAMFENSPGTNTNGSWIETYKPGEPNQLNPAYMPHKLTRQSDGTFLFSSITWDPREVGELETVSWPSFVGTTINDIFFHRNRLGLLSDESVVFSRNGDFFNLFPSSARQTLATDPIDVAVSHSKVSILEHAVAWNETVLFFSANTQFVLSDVATLTEETIAIRPSTEYACNVLAKPIGSGPNVFFSSDRGEYTTVREYLVTEESQSNDAADVTAHIPNYIPSDVDRLVVAPNEDALFATSKNNRRYLYCYKFYWNGTEKLQSAWQRWDMGADATLHDIGAFQSKVIVSVQRGAKLYYEEILLDPGQNPTGSDYQVMLDRRVDEVICTEVYDALTNTTTITTPIPYSTENPVLVCKEAGIYKFGQQLPLLEKVSDTEWKYSGNVTEFYMGLNYRMEYEFSKLYPKQTTQTGSQVPLTDGRLQLRRMFLNYGPSGYFRVEVQPEGRDVFTTVFSGKRIGKSVIGTAGFGEGRLSFPISARNTGVSIKVINDQPSPCFLLSAEWEGFYHTRSRRMG